MIILSILTSGRNGVNISELLILKVFSLKRYHLSSAQATFFFLGGGVVENEHV